MVSQIEELIKKDVNDILNSTTINMWEHEND